MPEPRELGNVARNVLIRLQPVLEDEIRLTAQIKHFMHLNRFEEAQKAQEEATELVMLVMRVITSLTVRDTKGAEEILDEYMQKKNKKS